MTLKKSLADRPKMTPEKSLADELKIPDRDILRNIATRSLVEVAEDKKAPAAARAAASRTLLESIGDIGRLQEVSRQAEKPLNEMNAQEVEAEIARLRPRV